jgi:hypothetical protein
MASNEKKEKFLKILISCAELYERKLSPAAIGLWWGVLSIYNIHDIEAAFEAHKLDPIQGKWMPKPCDIYPYLHPDHANRSYALSAWSIIRDAARERYNHPNPHDYFKSEMDRIGEPSKTAFRAIGGLERLTMMNIEGMQWLEKQFVEHFDCQKDKMKGERIHENARIAKESGDGEKISIDGIPWDGFHYNR